MYDANTTKYSRSMTSRKTCKWGERLKLQPSERGWTKFKSHPYASWSVSSCWTAGKFKLVKLNHVSDFQFSWDYPVQPGVDIWEECHASMTLKQMQIRHRAVPLVLGAAMCKLRVSHLHIRTFFLEPHVVSWHSHRWVAQSGTSHHSFLLYASEFRPNKVKFIFFICLQWAVGFGRASTLTWERVV
jgi:hypothetical protein